MFLSLADLPLLRQLTKDAQPYVRALAAEALASFSGPEALLLLREWALAPDDRVAAEGIRALASRCSRGELSAIPIGEMIAGKIVGR